MKREDTKELRDLESVAHDVVFSAVKVHKVLGPGLMESIYQKCLHHELLGLGHVVNFTFINLCALRVFAVHSLKGGNHAL
jgi:hypothetical protein